MGVGAVVETGAAVVFRMYVGSVGEVELGVLTKSELLYFDMRPDEVLLAFITGRGRGGGQNHPTNAAN